MTFCQLFFFVQTKMSWRSLLSVWYWSSGSDAVLFCQIVGMMKMGPAWVHVQRRATAVGLCKPACSSASCQSVEIVWQKQSETCDTNFQDRAEKIEERGIFALLHIFARLLCCNACSVIVVFAGCIREIEELVRCIAPLQTARIYLPYSIPHTLVDTPPASHTNTLAALSHSMHSVPSRKRARWAHNISMMEKCTIVAIRFVPIRTVAIRSKQPCTG